MYFYISAKQAFDEFQLFFPHYFVAGVQPLQFHSSDSLNQKYLKFGVKP